MPNQLYTRDEVDALLADQAKRFALATKSFNDLGSTGVASTDTRNENRPPQDYYALGKGFVQEFKFQEVVGLSKGQYCHLFTIIP